MDIGRRSEVGRYFGTVDPQDEIQRREQGDQRYDEEGEANEEPFHGRKDGDVLPGGRGVDKPLTDDRVGL